MSDWWARALGLIGIAISLATYWHGRPHLKITTKTAGVLGLGEVGVPWPCIVVTIANNGGADVRVSGVNLGGGRLVGKLLKGPAMPADVLAGGGRVNWLFDHADLAQQLGDLVKKELADKTKPEAVRAAITIGARVRRPRGSVVHVNPPGVMSSGRRVSWRERFDGWRRSWSRPVPTLDPVSMLTADSIDARQQILNVTNRYRRAARPSDMVLTVKHADESREVVSGQRPIPVPKVRGRRSTTVRVPFVDDSKATPGDEFQWVLRTRDGYGGQYVQAIRVSDIPRMAKQADQLRAMS